MNKIYYESINETVYHTVCDNGLNIHIIKKEGYAIKTAYFATKFGSFNSGDTIKVNNKSVELIGGLAHFLEHRVFDYKKGNVIDLYYKLGADVNAFTSYDRTVYYFSTTDNFKECLELLLDFPTSFTMTDGAVENEKDIIVNELLMYRDDPNDKLFKALMNAMYKEHPIKYDVGGEPDEVRETTKELLQIAHSTFYNPKNMHLVVVGDVDVDEVEKICRNKSFNMNKSIHNKKQIKEDLNVNKDSVVVEADVNNKKLLIGYKFRPLDNCSQNDKSKIFLSFDLLFSSLLSSSSEFYKKMIEEEYISSLSFDLLEYEGVFTLIIETDLLKDENIVFEKINFELNRALEVINLTKLENRKKKEIASIIRGSDSTLALAKNYMTYILDDMNYCTLIDLVKSIDLVDIEKVYQEYFIGAKYSKALLKSKDNN